MFNINYIIYTKYKVQVLTTKINKTLKAKIVPQPYRHVFYKGFLSKIVVLIPLNYFKKL